MLSIIDTIQEFTKYYIVLDMFVPVDLPSFNTDFNSATLITKSSNSCVALELFVL